MNIQCIKCKGRGFCGRKFCAVATKVSSQKRLNESAKQDFFGAAPNIFIGKYGYPDVNVGLLSTEQYNDHDAPLVWKTNNYQIQDIIDLRTGLINSSFRTNIKSFDDKMLELSQEVSLSSKPVDVEVNLSKKPFFNIRFNQDSAPHGPNVRLKKARLTENPKIPTKVDRMVSDTGLKAADAIAALRKDFDEHYLTKVFSVGNLGVKSERKLVPTRWSITAVDDIIGKQMIDEVKKCKESDYLAFFGGYLGTYYLILMFPNCWSYELFESVVGDTGPPMTDYEPYGGRKEYADDTAGGYYAARHAILEKLCSIKRQAGVLALRFITNEYWAPLGVWVCRESVRNAMQNKPIAFGSEELMLKYARVLINKKFGCDIEGIMRMSKLFDSLHKQKRICEFC